MRIGLAIAVFYAAALGAAAPASAQIHQPWEIMTDEAVGKRPPTQPTVSGALVERVNLQGAIGILTAAGLSGAITANPDGSRFVLGKMDAGPFQMLPLECERPGENCAAIRLYLGFAMREKPSIDRVNAFNRQTKDVRAYLDEEGDPAIEMDIPLSGGVSPAYLTGRILAWRQAVQGYQGYLGLAAPGQP